MINYKYFIVLFCNRKRKKLIHKSAKRSTITEIWQELKTQKKPPYIKTNSGKKRTNTKYEAKRLRAITGSIREKYISFIKILEN